MCCLIRFISLSFKNIIMKSILKISACILLMGIVIFTSCKKEISCESCKDNNKPPIANAGSDQTIVLPKDSVLLDGSSSTDADGTIKSYKWIKVSGPSSSVITKPDASVTSVTSVTSLIMGVYKFVDTSYISTRLEPKPV